MNESEPTNQTEEKMESRSRLIMDVQSLVERSADAPQWKAGRNAANISTTQLTLMITGEVLPTTDAPEWFAQFLDTVRQPSAVFVVEAVTRERADRLVIAGAQDRIAIRLDGPLDRSEIALSDVSALMEALSSPLSGSQNLGPRTAPAQTLEIPKDADLGGLSIHLSALERAERVVRYSAVLGRDSTSPQVNELLLLNDDRQWWRAIVTQTAEAQHLALSPIDNNGISIALRDFVSATVGA